MSRNHQYQHLLNSRRWQETKAIVWRRAGGQCEMCKAEGIAAGLEEGYVNALGTTLDCHHIIPVESARTYLEMQQLCFDLSNIKLLCVRHHIAVHTEAKSHTKERVKANKQQALERFKAANDPNYQPPST